MRAALWECWWGMRLEGLLVLAILLPIVGLNALAG